MRWGNEMGLIVQKFGGSSVANAEKIFNIAGIITDTYKKGNDVIAVVSAQGDTTDELIQKATEINPRASKREMDVLLSSGEQVSVSLLAMAIESLGYPVVSLLGWQAGIKTTESYGNARIKTIDCNRIKKELDKKNIVIAAGFQGLDIYGDITTFGRGGSDTSAVALAVATNADKCQIYTDVDGIYSADPGICKNAKKLEQVSYDEMLELASLGAQVLNNRCVEMAKKYRIKLEVLSSMQRNKGTIVRGVSKMEKTLVSGVAKDTNVARISLIGMPDEAGIAFRIFSKLSAKKINVDIILQSLGANDKKDITFTVAEDQSSLALKILEDIVSEYAAQIVYDTDVAKISLVGAGMETHSGIASKMFEAFYDAGINIQMISSSEIKISVLIEASKADEALVAVHDKFFDN